MGAGVKLLNKILDENGPKGVITFVAIGDHYMKAGKILRFDLLGKLKKDQVRFRSELEKQGFDVENLHQYATPDGDVLVKELKRPMMTRKDFLHIGVGGFLAAAWGGLAATDIADKMAGDKEEPKEETPAPSSFIEKTRATKKFLEGWPADLAEIGISVWLVNDAIGHWLTISKEWEEDQFEEVSNAVDAASEVLGIKPPLSISIKRDSVAR